MHALITARAARALDEDLAPLAAAMQAHGLPFEIVDWDDPGIDWSRYATAVVRSTWDYVDRYHEFCAWLAHVEGRTRLLNPPAVLRWNIHKGYLLELAARGVPCVPTTLLRPGDALALPELDELVVKPAIGAGSRDARRFRGDPAGALAHARALLDAGREVLVQPYLKRVDAAGETALMHFCGEYSHAIRKGPLLPANADATRALFAPEQIIAREPGADERALARQVLAALPFREPLLYARVDLLRGEDGSPLLLELELAEPSLFFAHAPGSAARFVAALAGT